MGTKLCVLGIHKLMEEIVSKCLTCQQVKRGHQRLRITIVATYPRVEMRHDCYGFRKWVF